MTHSNTQKPRQGVYTYMRPDLVCSFIKKVSICVCVWGCMCVCARESPGCENTFVSDRFSNLYMKCYVNVCVSYVCVCVYLVHCSCLHASERSERLAAESQGLRRQEIKHEMKTSSSLNILPSHFPISPLPLSDIKGRREGGREEREAWGEGWWRERGAGSGEKRQT